MGTLKRTLLALLLLASTNIFAQINYFEWQNMQRKYIVHTPAQHDGTTPVMFFLHGLGDNISRVDAEFNFSAVADRFGSAARWSN